MNRQDLIDYIQNKDWVEKRKDKIEAEYETLQPLVAKYGNEPSGSSAVQDKLAENLAILLDMKLESLNFAIQLEQKLMSVDKALLDIEQPYRNILTFV